MEKKWKGGNGVRLDTFEVEQPAGLPRRAGCCTIALQVRSPQATSVAPRLSPGWGNRQRDSVTAVGVRAGPVG